MDKHDRPYKCNVKGCEKLQGFTYSGGLLRHEREVHKMHGGTKKSLFCSFPDCKRSSGDGFMRKENLAEHIRRIHRNRIRDDKDLSLKRKRSRSDDAASTVSECGNEDIRDEIRRLRLENEEKDERLKQLEQAVMALQQQGRR